MKKKFEYANPYAEDYNKLINTICNDIKELSDKLSNLDKIQQEVLHYIECETLTDEQKIKIVEYLQCVRQERRGIKVKLMFAQQAKEKMKNTIEKKRTMSYTFNIDYEKDIFADGN